MPISLTHQCLEFSKRLLSMQARKSLSSNAFLMPTILLMSLLCLSSAQALTFHPRMDQAKWLPDSHVLQCQLTQPIPSFGRAVFDSSAGQPLRFYLQSVSSAMSQGQALLQSEAPTWNPALATVNLGLVKVIQGETPINLDAALADQLLNELYLGKSPHFIRRSKHSEERPTEQLVDVEQARMMDSSIIKVGLSSVHFRAAYSQYLQCLEQLMPVGFEQLSRSRVHFEADQWQLNAKTIDWLNTIVRYVEADTEVKQLYIDGYTDDLRSGSYNSQLSKKRAEAVAAYLIEKGISAEQVTTRFHGERFPVATNKTAEGRSTNRRVTIRLDKLGAAISQR
ncbi:OmpA family protein [Pseudomonadales bacterium]|nr:OmpA family protein [Pseudomonadales bacterium]